MERRSEVRSRSPWKDCVPSVSRHHCGLWMAALALCCNGAGSRPPGAKERQKRVFQDSQRMPSAPGAETEPWKRKLETATWATTHIAFLLPITNRGRRISSTLACAPPGPLPPPRFRSGAFRTNTHVVSIFPAQVMSCRHGPHGLPREGCPRWPPIHPRSGPGLRIPISIPPAALVRAPSTAHMPATAEMESLSSMHPSSRVAGSMARRCRHAA